MTINNDEIDNEVEVEYESQVAESAEQADQYAEDNQTAYEDAVAESAAQQEVYYAEHATDDGVAAQYAQHAQQHLDESSDPPGDLEQEVESVVYEECYGGVSDEGDGVVGEEPLGQDSIESTSVDFEVNQDRVDYGGDNVQ